MTNVTEISAYRKGPHVTGPCICLGCKHKWVGVVPAGVDSFDCPECGTEKGILEGLVNPPNGALACDGCGNLFVHVSYCGGFPIAFCPVCGDSTYLDLEE